MEEALSDVDRNYVSDRSIVGGPLSW